MGFLSQTDEVMGMDLPEGGVNWKNFVGGGGEKIYPSPKREWSPMYEWPRHFTYFKETLLGSVI